MAKRYNYEAPAKKEGEKAPCIQVIANNPMHAMQLLAERLGEKVDKTKITEVVKKSKATKGAKNPQTENVEAAV